MPKEEGWKIKWLKFSWVSWVVEFLKFIQHDWLGSSWRSGNKYQIVPKILAFLLIKMSYKLSYLENFHFSNLLAASEMKVFQMRQLIAHFDQ